MLRWLLIGTAAAVLLAVAVVASLPWLLNTRGIQVYVAQSASQALGRTVRFGSLSISPLPLPAVRLRDLQVAEDPAFGPGPFLTVSEGRLGIRLRPLFSGRVELADLTLDGPRVALVEDAAGRLNLASLGAAAGAAAPPRSHGSRPVSSAVSGVLLSRVRVLNGSVHYARLGEPAALRLEQVTLTLSQGRAGDTVRIEGSAVAEPGGVRLAIRQASIGPVASRAVADMDVKATVDVDAPDVTGLAGPYLGRASVSGAMTGRVEVSGTPARLSVAGQMASDRLTLSEERAPCGPPARRQLLVEGVRIPVRGGLQRLDAGPVEVRVARGTVSLRATVALDSARVATLREIRVRRMELAPVLVDYLCQPYAVTGALDLDGDATFRLADPIRSFAGAGRLRIGAGRVVGNEVVSLVREVAGLGAAVSAALRPDRPPMSSPLDFDSITATYTIAAGVARTDDLRYESRDVRVSAAGTYGLADQRVAMEVTLSSGANRIRGVISGAPGSLRVVPTGVRVPGAVDVKKFLDRLFR
jgi:AsmA protein